MTPSTAATTCFKAIEPALSGYCWGLMSVSWSTGTSSKYCDIFSLTISTLAFSAFPISGVQKCFAAVVLGAGTFYADRFKWYKQEKFKIFCIANIAVSLLELTQGQRAYPLAKISVVGLFLLRENQKLYQKIDVFLYKSMIVVVPLYLGGKLIRLAAPAIQKVADLDRRTKVIAAVVLTLTCMAIFVKYVEWSIHAHYARMRQRPRGERPMIPRQQ